MCGIVGYTGKSNAVDIVLEGLSKLEYRGYDSAGIAIGDDSFNIIKSVGKIKNLKSLVETGNYSSECAIGHTRWATHGVPSVENSHPHFNNDKTIAVVHNGIIENYASLKKEMEEAGYNFLSQTDTEVIAMLLDYYMNDDLYEAMVKTVGRLKGSYSIAAIRKGSSEIVATRHNAPLILGVGEGENLVASDILAMLSQTREFIYLEDNDIVRLSSDSFEIFSGGEKVEREKKYVDWDVQVAEKEGYDHFMIKEIFQQAKALFDTLGPRINNDTLDLTDSGYSKDIFSDIDKIYIIGCGTSYHAGRTGAKYFQKYLQLPVITDIASEFRYFHGKIDNRTLVLLLSQSGETADTLAALREARSQGAKVYSITNVVGSSIARESDHVFYTWAGPEIAVASTKAYTTQILSLYMICLKAAEDLGFIDEVELKDKISEVYNLISGVEKILANTEKEKEIAEKFKDSKNSFFIGRGFDYEASLEGALKLKEISYIHTEGFAAGELKHGTIALIENGIKIIAVITTELMCGKTISNVQELISRGADAYGIVMEGLEIPDGVFDDMVIIPKISEDLSVILSVTVLQIIAYYVAAGKGIDVDKPRNLAKSVTVE